VTFPALVDSANALGRALGYTAVPNMFYVDETGLFHGNITPAKLIEELKKPMADVPPDLRRRIHAAIQAATPADVVARLRRAADASPNDLEAQLAAGRSLLNAGGAQDAVAYLVRATEIDDRSTDAWMTLAAARLARADKPAALVAMKRARKLDPENWLIRKQIWALEHPEKFYDGPVDFKWQRKQLALEAQRAGSENTAPKP